MAKYFSLRPALNLSPTTTLFLVTADDLNHDKVQILAIDGQLSNLHINKNISANIDITSISPDAIEPITFSTINNNKEGDARVQNPIWYKGKLWFALNVGCFINGDAQSRSCIRIIEFDTNTSKVLLEVYMCFAKLSSIISR